MAGAGGEAQCAVSRGLRKIVACMSIGPILAINVAGFGRVPSGLGHIVWTWSRGCLRSILVCVGAGLSRHHVARQVDGVDDDQLRVEASVRSWRWVRDVRRIRFGAKVAGTGRLGSSVQPVSATVRQRDKEWGETSCYAR